MTSRTIAGPCDGTISFPNLGTEFDGTIPVALYGPDCGKPVTSSSPAPAPAPTPASSPLPTPSESTMPHVPMPSPVRVHVGDVPRVEVAVPADPQDPYLAKWINSPLVKGPVTFDGVGCSFAGP
jgi:hypothetical protein